MHIPQLTEIKSSWKARLRFSCAALLAMLLIAAGQSAAGSTLVSSTARFEFHSDPWLNAHHFLYQWARADLELEQGRLRVDVPERDELGSLPADKRAVWEAALDVYREQAARRNHLSDAMLKQKVELLKVGGDTNARPACVIDGLVDALASAMPVYLEVWWVRHDRSNRDWVDRVEPHLRRVEGEFAALTKRIFDARWSPAPIRTDVSAYANFRAGYTAFSHTVMYSTDAGNQGLYSLEMLLHEVLHHSAIGSAGRARQKAEFAARGAGMPGNLWHAIIFLTAGEFVRQYASHNGLPEHVPYAEREGIFDAPGWQAPAAAARDTWLPAVTGKLDPAAAARQLAATWLPGPSARD